MSTKEEIQEKIDDCENELESDQRRLKCVERRLLECQEEKNQILSDIRHNEKLLIKYQSQLINATNNE